MNIFRIDVIANPFKIVHPTDGQVAILQHHPGTILHAFCYHVGCNGTCDTTKCTCKCEWFFEREG